MKETDIRAKKEFLHILNVEDDNSLAQLISSILTAEGHTITWARSAEEAMTILQNQDEEFDAIYLDIQLPKMDGIQFCQIIRDTPHPRQAKKSLAGNAWVVAVTSLDSPEDVINALNAGANDYLPKPITPKALRIKTAVCRYASNRIRAFRLRIAILEKEISGPQRKETLPT